MPVHRSIIRTRRNENTTRAFNACAAFACYIALNIIYRKYWIIINGSTMAIIVCGCTVICCLNGIDHETDSESDSLTDIESISEDGSEVDEPTSTDTVNIEVHDAVSVEIPPLTAYPITTEEYFTSDISLTADKASFDNMDIT
jgi:hypothetical protein